MSKKPQWLINCWALAPNIAREAERFINAEKSTMHKTTLNAIFTEVRAMKYKTSEYANNTRELFNSAYNSAIDDVLQKLSEHLK